MTYLFKASTDDVLTKLAGLGLLFIAFGTEESETKFGTKRRPAKRSGEVKKEEYSLLIDQLIITAANMGFAIPPPDTEF